MYPASKFITEKFDCAGQMVSMAAVAPDIRFVPGRDPR